MTLSRSGDNLQLYINRDNVDSFDDLSSLTIDSVISAKGVLKDRPSASKRTDSKFGDVELEVRSIEILNRARPLPIVFREDHIPDEEKRLEFRYVDLRRDVMQRNIRLRSAIIQSMRSQLCEEGFVEIETPLLFKSTPEGANEFIVEKGDGTVYALPQSPQQFKQLLVIGGFEKYFQVARCFRNEDLRSDRQPEFTQLDVEMGFAGEAQVQQAIESLIGKVWKKHLGLTPQFTQMTYDRALRVYGTDKPDIRCPELAISALSEDAACIEECIKIPEHFVDASILELFNSASVNGTTHKTFNAADSSFVATRSKLANVGSTLLGRIRTAVLNKQSLLPNLENFLWVTEFPLFCGSLHALESMHHPFTAPLGSISLSDDPLKIKARHYDLVLNGTEVGGGSVRIHNSQLQRTIFKDYLKLPDAKVSQFRHLLDALDHGAPPHAGIALGLDRLIASVCGVSSIREVIAFPKNSSGHDLLFKTPVRKN